MAEGEEVVAGITMKFPRALLLVMSWEIESETLLKQAVGLVHPIEFPQVFTRTEGPNGYFNVEFDSRLSRLIYL